MKNIKHQNATMNNYILTISVILHNDCFLEKTLKGNN